MKYWIALILSLVLYTLTDFCIWHYYTYGGSMWSEAGKLCMLGTVITSIWFVIEWMDKNFMKLVGEYLEWRRMAIGWLFLHFVVHQTGTGLLRHGNPLYLGSGAFDRIVMFMSGGAWWFYLLILIVSLGIGIDLLTK